MLFRTSGLNFRRKRRKMKLSTAKSAAAWAVEILIVLLVAFVLVYCAGMRVTTVSYTHLTFTVTEEVLGQVTKLIQYYMRQYVEKELKTPVFLS